MRRYLLHLMSVIALMVGVTGCVENEQLQPEKFELEQCWGLKSFCGTPVDADILIDFEEGGEFTIYQRTQESKYIVFTGTYEADEANSLLTGEYSDGTSWSRSYNYTVDKVARELALVSVEMADEVSVYEPAKLPADDVIATRSAWVSDVKPL